MDWLITLGAIGLVALIHAFVESQEPPPPAAPRRNYDVLAPAAPRVGATRLTPAQRDVLLTLRVFGSAEDTILVIRPEARDARQ